NAGVYGIEAVRGVEKIVRRLRRAADPGNLRHPVRLDREIEACLDDGGGDRIVSAAGAQRGNLSLVIAMRKAECILRQGGVVEFRLGDIGHETTLRSGVTF